MFGLTPDLESIRRRISELEDAVAMQQQLIEQLLAETGVQSSIPASLRPKPGGLHPEVLALLRNGKDIAAIKRHRELTGAGLREAKERIDKEKGRL